MSKAEKIANFNPSGQSLADTNIFGLPFTNQESDIIVVPVPWEVTVSYRGGTASGPKSIFEASPQVDLYDSDYPDFWKLGIGMAPISKELVAKNKLLRKKAEKCIDYLYNGGNPTDTAVAKTYAEINKESVRVKDYVKKETTKWLNEGKMVCVLGGEHSTPLGFMEALAENTSYSILHIDAHADLRKGYEGFEFSHASIQYHASKIKQIDRLVQVGIRDYSEEEAKSIEDSNGRIVAFSDLILKRNSYQGMPWKRQCKEIIKNLSKNVYVSFDVDGLNPSLCPHTGTPVPGGLEFEEVMALIETVVSSGKKIIGFDISEVAPGKNDDWDATVGARALYRLSAAMAKSQTK